MGECLLVIIPDLVAVENKFLKFGESLMENPSFCDEICYSKSLCCMGMVFMGCAICVAASNSSKEKICNLWDGVSRFEKAPSMRALSYPPHFTFAIYSEMDVQELQDKLGNIFKGVLPISVTFDQIRHFDASPLVLWLSPKNNSALAALHSKIHSIVSQHQCSENYRPSRWIPHCTLATDILEAKRAEALKYASAKIDPLEVIFDRVDFIDYPPIRIAESIFLSNAQ